jgi:hypothetical protein
MERDTENLLCRTLVMIQAAIGITMAIGGAMLIAELIPYAVDAFNWLSQLWLNAQQRL